MSVFSELEHQLTIDLSNLHYNPSASNSFLTTINKRGSSIENNIKLWKNQIVSGINYNDQKIDYYANHKRRDTLLVENIANFKNIFK